MSDLQPRLKFNQSKVITPRTTTRPRFLHTRSGKSVQIGTETEVNQYTDLRWSYGGSGKSGRKVNVPIPRAIQMYRWWFRYLKLAVELESQGYTFVERKKVPVKKKGRVGYEYKEVKEEVIVNQEKYDGWDLDEVLSSTFDRWWSRHHDLFIERPTHAVEIKSSSEMIPDQYSRYFKVDSRMGTNDTIKSLRELLSSPHGKRIEKRTARWVVTGTMRQETMFNCYNSLVMWLQGGSGESILKSGLFRMSRGSKVEWLEDIGRGDTRKKKEDYVARPSAQNLNKLRDLLIPGRRLVLTVSDGYFSKHPRNKVYFKG